MLGKIKGRRRMAVTEDEMVGQHHQLNGHEFEQTLGDSEGQGSLACCSPWGCKESDMTWQLNNNKKSSVLRTVPSSIFIKYLLNDCILSTIFSALKYNKHYYFKLFL